MVSADNESGQAGVPSARRSIVIRGDAFDRFARFKKGHESRAQAFDRLLDEAGVPDSLECAACGGPIRGRYVGQKPDGDSYHIDCAKLVLDDTA